MDNYITLNQLKQTTQSLLLKINDNKDYSDNQDTSIKNRVSTLENAGYQTSAQVNSAIANAIEDSSLYIVELTYIETNDSSQIWQSAETVKEIKTKIDNNIIVILKANKELLYFTGYDRGSSDLSFYGGMINDYTACPATGSGNTWMIRTNVNIVDWDNIADKPTIPEATTITNTLTSGTRIATINNTDIYAPEGGSGGIATETDPVFSASAAAGITAEKISAWDAKSDFSGSYNDLSDKPTIPTVPTNISAFTNDSGYLTSYTETDPTVPAWAKAESKPTYTAQEVGALPNDTVIPTVPTNVSAFTNDAGYLTSYTETDPTVPSWAKASTKPTYTASEVGAAASSHVHGNVKNDGTITVNTSMTNGDRLLFSDTSDSSKIKNTSITIGTSTTQYLANNGTWQNLPTISVSQTLTSGTEIGSVNNTKLYAPTPYDDSALAARVTALEQLEWATYYSGRSNPSNSQGQNGDIYLQY